MTDSEALARVIARTDSTLARLLVKACTHAENVAGDIKPGEASRLRAFKWALAEALGVQP